MLKYFTEKILKPTLELDRRVSQSDKEWVTEEAYEDDEEEYDVGEEPLDNYDEYIRNRET